MTQVLSVGIAALDCIFDLTTMPASAEKHVAKDVHWVVGGCAANAAVAMARLGGQVSLATQVGDDSAGDIITSHLRREGIDLSPVIRHHNARSAVSSIFVDAQGERQIVNFRGDFGNHRQSPQKPLGENPFNDVDLQHLRGVLADTRWLAGAEAALRLARQKNIPGVLDAEAPIPESLLQQATHVAFSRTGLLSVCSRPSLEEALLEMAGKLSAWVCVTDGANGVYSEQHGAIHHHRAHAVTAVDTLGAGDVWHGAFCLQLAQGSPESICIEFANAAAALKCCHHGGGDAAPTLANVESFMHSTNRS